MEIEKLDGVRLDCACGDENHIVFIERLNCEDYQISYVGDWRMSLLLRIKAALRLIFKNPYVYYATVILNEKNVQLIQEYFIHKEQK